MSLPSLREKGLTYRFENFNSNVIIEALEVVSIITRAV
jgi:hypothetical protein